MTTAPIVSLSSFLERHGQVVEKAELIQLIWPDATVDEIGLARNISPLRKGLDDEAPDSPIIETIPRRGYRFAAALAVVPFPCACPGVDAEAYTEPLTDLLVTDLSETPTLPLVAPSTVRRHQRAGMSTSLMGLLLGLDALVEGSVQLSGADLRTTVRHAATQIACRHLTFDSKNVKQVRSQNEASFAPRKPYYGAVMNTHIATLARLTSSEALYAIGILALYGGLALLSRLVAFDWPLALPAAVGVLFLLSANAPKRPTPLWAKALLYGPSQSSCCSARTRCSATRR